MLQMGCFFQFELEVIAAVPDCWLGPRSTGDELPINATRDRRRWPLSLRPSLCIRDDHPWPCVELAVYILGHQ